MNEHEIGRELESLVPEPPATPERAARALALAGRRRRRRASALAAAAVVVVVGAGVAVTALPDGGHRRAPAGTPTSTPTTGENAPVACPAPLGRKDPAPQMDDERALPEGATSAVLCPVYASFGFQAPEDPLRGPGVAELVDEIDSQQVASPDTPCTADGGITYQILLGYSDGSTRTVYGQKFGCRSLSGAGPLRSGADVVWDSYLVLLRHQRLESRPPGETDVRLTCPGTRFPYADSPMALTTEAVRGRLCWRRTDTETNNAWTGVDLDDDQLTAILSALRDRDNAHQPTEQECRDADLQFSLVGIGPWNDIGHTSGDCGVFEVDGEWNRALTPSAQRIVDHLVAEHGTSATPSITAGMSPASTLEALVDLLNDPERRHDAEQYLADDVLLADAGRGRLELKVDGWRRIPTPKRISAPVELARVTALYRVVGDDVMVPYRRATFTLSRLSEGQHPWTVVRTKVGAIEPTGR